jgi:hypothetical protein
VSNFAILEVCFIIITLLALFLRETILSLSLVFLIFKFVLYLASCNSVAISIKSSTVPLSIRHIKLEVFLLVVLFLNLVINTCS